MKKKTVLVTIAVIAVVAVALILLPLKKDQAASKKFAPYISAYTSGVITNQSTIRVMLTGSSGAAQKGEQVDEELFDFSPDIEGDLYWVDNRTIEFRPKEKLPSGKLFEAEFMLNEVMEVPKELSSFPFEFQTIEQDYETENKGIRAYNPQGLQHQMLLGQLRTSDYASPIDVEKMLDVTQDGNELNVTWVHKPDGKIHKYTVDSVSRKETPSEVQMEWNGKPINADKDKEETITIPSLSNFEVMNIDVTHQPNQYISLYFSDPIDEKQELEGLIYFESGTSVKVSVDGNEVKVYPVAPLTNKKTLVVDPAVKNSPGYALKERWTSTINFTSKKPSVKFLGDGNILPSSNGLVLPFKAVNLSGVNVQIIKVFEKNIAQFFQVNQYNGEKQLKRVGRIVHQEDVDLSSKKPVDLGKWNTFALDLSEMINVEPGAIYRVQINFRKDQSLYPCDEASETEKSGYQSYESVEEGNESDVRYWHYKGYDYYNYNDDYNWKERDNPCKKSYYLRYRQAITKNVLASDFGIIAKRGAEDEMVFAVSDLKSTDPISGVNIGIYNFQQKLITETETDAEGMARVEYEDSKPFFVVAQKESQYGYLRVDDGSSLSLSKFNVSGRETQHGLKGFIYGERGVWRPGDSLFISFMLHDEQNTLPENHPVMFEMSNPRGQVVTRRVTSSGVNGLYAFRTKTEPDAPTGTWEAKVKVGGATFSKDLKIETIKPNRLKMELDFDTDIFSYQDKNPSGNLHVEWLHGATAGNLKAEVKMKLAEANTRFDDYPGFTFEDESRKFSSFDKTIFEDKVNSEGNAVIKPDLHISSKPSGMLNTYFTIKAYEESGNFSTTQKMVPYSPYKCYVGLKVPKGDGWHGALSYDKEYTLPVVTVDEEGNSVGQDNLEVEIYKVKWRWWWERNEQDNLSRYVGSSSRYLMHEGALSTENGKGFYNFTIGEKYWGRVYIRVVDKETGHSAGKIAYVSYPGWSQDELPGGATMLQFTTDKDTYEVGDEIVAKLPTNGEGRAFVSLENGSRVLETFWVETAEKFTRFTFEATEEMSPNVYVHVSMIQPHNVKDNDLPIRMYGVQPVKVENKESHLHPEVDMPEKVQPQQEVEFRVKEKHGKPMNYTVAVVDVGLLDITAYKTPEPWKHFYARDALGVKTWDLYDYVIGAYSGEFAGLFEVGGGLDMKAQDKKSANRFKPVVKFFGPFHLKKKKTNRHTFKMPQYIGSVKTMVVASHEKAFGSGDATTSVKKPLMVQATLPRVIGPQEEINIPVTVFAMEEGIDNVKVKVETNELLEAAKTIKSVQTIHFDKPGDKTINFLYKVPEKLGVAKVKITAMAGSETAVSETELQVRTPNPRTTKVLDASLKENETFSENVEPVGMEGTNNGMLEVSRFMPINLEKRLKFLIRYPHGCIEQTTSSVFPQLYLENMIELSNQRKDEIQGNVCSGINRMREFQLPEGGFGYWPGSGSVSHWGTNYAGHFLLEAKDKGYDIPTGLLNGWISYQRKAANNWRADDYYDTRDNSTLVQAYRLYTLALEGSPAQGAMNRMRKMDKLSMQAKWRLAAAYELTGKSKAAREIIEGLSTDVKKYRELGNTYGSNIRDRSMILETLMLMEDSETARKVAMELGERLGSEGWYSTQTTAYALLAVSKFLGDNKPDEPMRFEYSIDGNNWKNVVSDVPVAQIDLPVENTASVSVKVKNKSSNMLFSRVILDGIPAIGEETSEANDLKMNVHYTNMDGESIDPSQIEQGTDFRAIVSVTHPGIRKHYEELALTQVFPSGWEIHNFRLDQTSSYQNQFDSPEYQDIRADRVFTYFDLKPGDTKKFVFQLNATYLGKYYMPAVRCEAMYDNSISAQKQGKWVEVLKPGTD